MIDRIHIVNGPNLNLIGRRQPEIYGSIPVDEYIESIREGYLMAQLDYFQSNHEGAIIDYLHHHGFEKNTGIILNAGGFSHTSIALMDAVLSIDVPVVEIHISDIASREPFRQHSYLTNVCESSIIGKGMEGYRLAIDFLLNT